MRFQLNLIIVQAHSNVIYPIEFSAAEFDQNMDPNISTVIGAYVNLNHYMAILSNN